MRKFLRICALALAASIALLFTACSDDGKTVMTVGKVKVPASEYAYYIKSTLSSLETYGLDISALGEEEYKSLEDSFKENAYAQCVRSAVVQNKAEELGLKLTSDDKKQLKENKNNVIAQMGGNAAFKQELTAAGMPESFFDKMSEISLLYEKLYTHYYGEAGEFALTQEEVRAYFEENYVTVKHILRKTIDDSNAPLSDEAAAQKKEEADAVYTEIMAGADFDTLMKENTEDPGLATNPNGYTFSQDESYDPVFKQKAFELEIGEVSEPVLGSSGYHIIKRVPLDETYWTEKEAELTAMIAQNALEDKIREWTEGYEITKTEEYDNITLKNIDLY